MRRLSEGRAYESEPCCGSGCVLLLGFEGGGYCLSPESPMRVISLDAGAKELVILLEADPNGFDDWVAERPGDSRHADSRPLTGGVSAGRRPGRRARPD
jgi:hypothetical protein